MYRPDKDLGVMMALLQRLEKYRLPTALKLKEKVDRGEMMDKSDMTFLDQMAADAQEIKPYLDRNPQYDDLATQVTGLFREIPAKALENEKNQQN